MSWVGSVLDRSCTASHNGRLGYRLSRPCGICFLFFCCVGLTGGRSRRVCAVVRRQEQENTMQILEYDTDAIDILVPFASSCYYYYSNTSKYLVFTFCEILVL